MNTLAIIFGIIALIFIWWNLWVSIKIVKYLKSKGENASLFSNGIYVKGKIFKYLTLYNKISLESTGKVGQLYIEFYISFFLFIIFLIFGIAIVA